MTDPNPLLTTLRQSADRSRPPHARAMHSISMSNSMGQDATGTKVREGGFSGKKRA
jgi:hypothetical protein